MNSQLSIFVISGKSHASNKFNSTIPTRKGSKFRQNKKNKRNVTFKFLAKKEDQAKLYNNHLGNRKFSIIGQKSKHDIAVHLQLMGIELP